jgi:hypothetical protein
MLAGLGGAAVDDVETFLRPLDHRLSCTDLSFGPGSLVRYRCVWKRAPARHDAGTHLAYVSGIAVARELDRLFDRALQGSSGGRTAARLA